LSRNHPAGNILRIVTMHTADIHLQTKEKTSFPNQNRNRSAVRQIFSYARSYEFEKALKQLSILYPDFDRRTQVELLSSLINDEIRITRDKQLSNARMVLHEFSTPVDPKTAKKLLRFDRQSFRECSAIYKQFGALRFEQIIKILEDNPPVNPSQFLRVLLSEASVILRVDDALTMTVQWYGAHPEALKNFVRNARCRSVDMLANKNDKILDECSEYVASLMSFPPSDDRAKFCTFAQFIKIQDRSQDCAILQIPEQGMRFTLVAQDGRIQQKQTIGVYAQLRKDTASFYSRASSDLCSSDDLQGWHSKNFLQLVLFEEQSNKPIGNIQLHLFHRLGRRGVICRINPNQHFLSRVDIHECIDELVALLHKLCRMNSLVGFLPMQEPSTTYRTNRVQVEKSLERYEGLQEPTAVTLYYKGDAIPMRALSVYRLRRKPK
jgi:hypothetical protein